MCRWCCWLGEKDDLFAGRSPREDAGGLTVKGLTDRFLTMNLSRVNTDELSPHSYRDYVYSLQQMADVFGKNRLVSDLRPSDFEQLRNSFVETHEPARLTKDVTTVRSLFKYADKSGLIENWERLVGPEFTQPTRTARLKASRAHDRKDFAADE